MNKRQRGFLFLIPAYIGMLALAAAGFSATAQQKTADSGVKVEQTAEAATK